MIIIIGLLCIAALSSGSLAASNGELGLSSLKESKSAAPQEEITILFQDGVKNFSEMNLTFLITPTLGSAQAVRFTAPKPNWNLRFVQIWATDGWNASSQTPPAILPFAIEIRDSNLRPLYHFSDVQFPYFTRPKGPSSGPMIIDFPNITINGAFYVCFYGYRSLALAAEMGNGTGNSFLFDKVDNYTLLPVELTAVDNQTTTANWLIRAAGS